MSAAHTACLTAALIIVLAVGANATSRTRNDRYKVVQQDITDGLNDKRS